MRSRSNTALARRGAVALLAVTLALAVTLPAAAQDGKPGFPSAPIKPAAGQSPKPLRDVGFDQRLGEQVPLDLPFVDSQGRSVELGQYFADKPVVLALVYFDCPMLCPMTLNGLASSLKALTFEVGKDFDVVVVSFNPKETPKEASSRRVEVIHQYGRSGTDGGWHFLTGEESSISRLAKAVGFRYTYLPDKGEYAHAAGIVVLTPGGQVARYFFGIEYPPKDLRLGLVEATDGTIGSPVDQLLLYCFHYDPEIGRYSAVTLNILRLAGAVTVIALVLFIVIMVRRERKRTRNDLRTA